MLSGGRFAFCTAEVGAGHSRAGRAVADALGTLAPSAGITHIDALSHAPAWFVRAYRDGYLATMRRLPRLAGWLYDRTDAAPEGRAGGVLSVAIERRALAAFSSLDAIRAADAVVCSHFLCARVLSAARARGQIGGRLCVVVTDQHPHAIWQVPGVDLYLVGTRAAERTLTRRGVAPDRVRVTGIPIDPLFERPPGRELARAHHGLPREGPVVLVCGGGLGLGGLDRVVHGLLAARVGAHIVVVCGRNAALEARLNATLRGHPERDRCHILGHTGLMHELMAASDLVISKPGGLTTAESLSLGLPMILLRPIPGQEDRNADLLVGAGAALLRPDPADAAALAAALIADQARLYTMGSRAAALGRRSSARAAAEAVLATVTSIRPMRPKPARTEGPRDARLATG